MTADLSAFLLARVAEDEAAARAASEFPGGDRIMAALPQPIFDGLRPGFPARVLAQTTAIRRIVEGFQPFGELDDINAPEVLRILATIWRDHPDYRPEEWA